MRAKACFDVASALALRTKSRVMRSATVVHATADDSVVMLFAAASVSSYYLDMLLDAKQLMIFGSEGDWAYLAANASGILAAAAMEPFLEDEDEEPFHGPLGGGRHGALRGHVPFLEPARLLRRMLSLREALPEEPSDKDMALSAQRFVELRRLKFLLAKILLVEATVEGAVSQLVQGQESHLALYLHHWQQRCQH